MNSNKIAEFIKDIRKKDNLTQEKFAQKYNVTYQAVSKWETAKSIPDITILKKICNDYNKDINELLDVKANKKKYIKLIIVVLIILILIVTLFLILKKNESFEFKPLKTTCDNFNLYGSIAYNKNKTSVYISNISYCGKEDNTKYKEIKCTLYESSDKQKNVISTYSYSKSITLEDFLKKVNFNVDHYSKTCKMYKENGMYLEIDAIDNNDELKVFRIPLELDDNC